MGSRIVQNVKKTTLSTPPPRLCEHPTVDDFVSDKTVMTGRSLGMLRQMYVYYPKTVMCVSNLLTKTMRVWKINWHWELLLSMLHIAGGMAKSPANVAQVKRLVARLMEVAPRPPGGFILADDLCTPSDASSDNLMKHRHSVVMDCKQAFKPIVLHEHLATQPMTYARTTPAPIVNNKKANWWELAVATIDPPGVSKHQFDYAFDLAPISKDVNTKETRIRIEDISLALGCTFRNDEGSHVHVEFAHGVRG